MYYIAIPRTLFLKRMDFGVWDVIKNALNDNYMTFETREEAIKYAETNIKGEFYVVKIVG